MPLLHVREARTVRWGAERIPHPQLLKDFNLHSPTPTPHSNYSPQPFNFSTFQLFNFKLETSNYLAYFTVTRRVTSLTPNSGPMPERVRTLSVYSPGISA